MTDARPVDRPEPEGAPALRPLAGRPPLGPYLSAVWSRRDFAVALALARLRAENAQDVLGSAWQLLNPLLLAGVYYVVFGLILRVDRGIDNFVTYLTVGVLVFTASNRSAQAGASALVSNRSLTRSLRFPRAVLPVTSVLVVTASLAPGLVVMAAVALLTGEPVRPVWLLVLPALALQFAFNVGLALTLARLTARLHDVQRALPFVLRAWLYFSGVFYSFDRFVDDRALLTLLEANPVYVYMTLVRAALTDGITAGPGTWALAAGWAVAAAAVGVLVFWRGEGAARPGRE